jgi:hypothetical protein
MASPRKLPDTDVLVRLAERGLSNREIGALFGTSRQAVEQRLEGIDIDRAARVTCPTCGGAGDIPPQV